MPCKDYDKNYEKRIDAFTDEEKSFLVARYSDTTKSLTSLMRDFKTKFNKNIETFMISRLVERYGIPKRPKYFRRKDIENVTKNRF